MPVLASRKVADFGRQSRKCHKKFKEGKVQDFIGQINPAKNVLQDGTKSAAICTLKYIKRDARSQFWRRACELLRQDG